jgi:hypothetical protein
MKPLSFSFISATTMKAAAAIPGRGDQAARQVAEEVGAADRLYSCCISAKSS